MSPASDGAAEAVLAFLEPLRLAANTTTQDRLITCGYTPDELHTVTFGGQPLGIRLRARHGSHITLRCSHQFRVTADPDGWRVHTEGYVYVLEDDGSHELVSYHWHPRSEVSSVGTPHMHVPAQTALHDLHHAHFPTGRVSFESVIRFAIEEFGVVPLANDYRQRLAEAEARFRTHGTWF